MPLLSKPALIARTPLKNYLKPLIANRGLATVTDHNVPPYLPPYANVSSKPLPAALKLKTGQIFHGTSFGAPISVSGEAVFTTSLVGYPESMTDASYRGQILTFTQPLIGNYGVPGLYKDQYGLLEHFESDRIQVEGIIVGDYATKYSHWTAVESLGEWCARHNVPAISGVDTRAITHLLRDQGSTLAKLDVGDESSNTDLSGIEYNDPNERNLVSEVSTKVPLSYNPFGDLKIAVIDCGAKQNILRSLIKRGAAVTVLPWNFDFTQVADQFDGLFISNGPGNPKKAAETADTLRKTLDTYQRPIFGICMGNLVLGMAAGLDVYKLRFGNRGHNVPAVNMVTGKCVITSQNHGYALKDDVMPAGWKKYFVNANDYSNEGIRHITRPVRSVQFHPEAKGGPRDTEYLFEEFLDQVRDDKVKREGVKVFVPETSIQQPTVSV